MKRKIFSFCLVLVAVLMLFALASCDDKSEKNGGTCDSGHTWVAADCDTPKTCSACGATEGEALGHTWVAADCDSKKTCSACGETSGEALGHTWVAADCDSKKTCSSCGATEGEALGHDYSKAEKSSAQHWVSCSVCGDEQAGSRFAHDDTRTVTKKATTFETGTAIHACPCGYSYEETISATKSLKILAIGNSFSADAMRWLYIVCKDAGIETVLLGNLYKGASTLDVHLSYMENNSANYKFYLSDAEAENMVVYKDGATALEAIEYADWDFITLQQGSSKSGLADSYSYLEGVIDYVNEHKNEDTQLLWHMTWAYQSDSSHAAFADYNRDQLTMYNGILSCVQQRVLTHKDIKGVIPSGTTIQNLRNSHLGDTLTRDGYHLSYTIGRYAAALTYLAAITGYDISNITVLPGDAEVAQEIGEHLACIKEAVANAIAKPYEITPSTEYPYVAPPAFTTTELTAEDRSYLEGLGLNADEYAVLDFDYTVGGYYKATANGSAIKTTGSIAGQYIATEIFGRDVLTNGSVIRITESGYQYRPEGWMELNQNITVTRPGNVSDTTVVVDDAWWGDWNYRAFNISANDSHTMTDAEAAVLRIYVKTA